MRRWWIATSTFVVCVVILLILISRSDDVLEQGNKLAPVLGALIVSGGFVISVMQLVSTRRAARGSHAERLGQAANDLAQLVAKQWERKADARGITRPVPLEVRWCSTKRPVMPKATEIVGSSLIGVKPIRLKLNGDVSGLARAFQKLPARQLVVIGEPGAGKTSAAILLTMNLVAQRAPDEPVPVMLALASWDPISEPFESWMARQLSVGYAIFGKRGVHGPEIAQELVENSKILPILDGLDEVASTVRNEAIRSIVRTVGRNRPLIVTCRSDDYEEIVRTTGLLVGRAAVVELISVTADVVAAYLEAGNPVGDTRWMAVVERLRQEPNGELAQALSTPLMVYLARTAFTSRDTNPNDLLSDRTPDDVENHVLDAYIPALYPPGAPGANATRWLAFLAHRLANRPGVGLSWWRLFLLLPWCHVVVSATRGALLAAVLLSGIFSYAFATYSWDDVSVPAIFVGFLMLLLSAALGGAVLGTLVGLLWSAMIRYAGYTEERLVHLPRYVPVEPWRMVRSLINGAIAGAAIFAIVGTLQEGAKGVTGSWLLGGAMCGLVFAANMSIAKPVSVDGPVHPHDSISADRRTALGLSLWTVGGISLAFTTRLLVEGDIDVVDATLFSALATLVLAWLLPLSCAWTKFTVARFWLWVFGKAPWRLMEFLDDAHEKGVLRRVGGTYQFRHQRLQQYLATKYPGR